MSTAVVTVETKAGSVAGVATTMLLLWMTDTVGPGGSTLAGNIAAGSTSPASLAASWDEGNTNTSTGVSFTSSPWPGAENVPTGA
ncbi:MAG: hypothetical protein ACKOCK_04025 [Chloroflexota bacterium]